MTTEFDPLEPHLDLSPPASYSLQQQCMAFCLLLLCYLILASLTALVPAPNTSTPRLPTGEIITSESLKTSTPPSLSSNSSALVDNFLLPYRFKVPDTNILLRLCFGIRRSLDRNHMRSLIAVAEDYIDEQIAALPPATPDFQHVYPVAQGRNQTFYESLDDAIWLVIGNHHQIGKLFTWDDLEDVVMGLRMYLVDGDRFWQTWFRFYVGDVAPDTTMSCMGYGSPGPEEYGRSDEMDAELAAEERR